MDPHSWPHWTGISRVAAALALGFALRSAAAGQAEPPPKPDLTDDYAIYSKLLDWELRDGHGEKPRPIVVVAETVKESPGRDSFDASLPHIKKDTGVSQETLDDFAARNKATVELAASFKSEHPCVLVSMRDLRALQESSGADFWRAFRKKYPDSAGYVAFSRVGFNKDRTEALVYIGHTSGFLAGIGQVVFLRKTKAEGRETWTVVRIAGLWVS